MLSAEIDPLAPIPWGAARCLLGQLRAHLGGDAIAVALSPHKVLLSLVLRGLDAELTEVERTARYHQSYACLSQLPNMLPHPLHLIECWAEVLADLIPADAAVVFPSVTSLDVETMLVLRSLLRRRAEGPPLSLLLGHDPSDRPADSLAAEALDVREEQLPALSTLPGSEVVVLKPEAAEGADSAAGQYGWPADPLDDDLERRAFSALRRASGPLDEQALQLVEQAAAAAFGAFGHPAALSLSVELLKRHPTVSSAALFHHIASMSSYAQTPLAFVTRAPAEIVDLAAHHLEQALELAQDADTRVPIYYRLAMIAVRHRGDMEEGVRWSDLAVEQAASVRSPARAAFLEARARAGRSLARYRLGRVMEARRDCQEALEVLQGSEGATDIPATEVQVAEFVLTDNFARVCTYGGQRDAARACLERCVELDSLLPEWRKPLMVRSLLEGAEFHLDLAIAHVSQRLEHARALWDPEAEAYRAYQLGALLHRRGEAGGAYECYGTAIELWSRMGTDDSDVLAAKQNRAISALHAGWLDKAEREFAEVAEHPLCDDPGIQAEILGALALVAARSSAEDGALTRARRALELATRCEEADVLVRVRRSAADAFLRLGQAEPALEQLERALKLSAKEDLRLPPEDLLGLHVSWLDASERDRVDHVHQALWLIPKSLREPTAWWELPRLLPHVAWWLEASSDQPQRDQRTTAALGRFLGAAAQRVDSQALAKELWVSDDT